MKLLINIPPEVEGAITYLQEVWGIRQKTPVINAAIAQMAREVANKGHDWETLHYHLDTAKENELMPNQNNIVAQEEPDANQIRFDDDNSK